MSVFWEVALYIYIYIFLSLLIPEIFQEFLLVCESIILGNKFLESIYIEGFPARKAKWDTSL